MPKSLFGRLKKIDIGCMFSCVDIGRQILWYYELYVVLCCIVTFDIKLHLCYDGYIFILEF